MIREFQGEYRWLSNFWPCRIEHGGKAYPSVEHAYQAEKFSENAKVWVDKKEVVIRDLICEAIKPGEAKRLARRYSYHRRKDWHEISMNLMLNLLREKFKIPELHFKLLATRNRYLQEGNLWNDTFWGVDLRTGNGENHLGKLLMQVRDELRKEYMKPEMEMPICEVCDKNQAVGVCCVPGVPISCAYCGECLRANAHPWWVLVANTVCVGGLENAVGEWKEMVEDTCRHLGKTMKEFNQEVQKEINNMDRVEKEALYGKKITKA